MQKPKTFETEEGLKVTVDVAEVVAIEQSLWKKTSKDGDERAGAVLTLRNKSRVDVYGESFEYIHERVLE